MSSTVLQSIAAALNWQLRVNENFVSVSPAGLYGINPATTTGLTLGFLGGEFSGVAVADGTVALTLSTTNYVVAHRTTGVVTSATNTTNWLNTATYLRLYQVVTGASTITSIIDKRQAYGDSSAAGLTNPMTTTGDMIYSSSGSTPARLGVGTNGHVLTLAAGVPSWAAPVTGFTNPMTTAGDLITGGSGGTAGRLAVGANDGEILTVVSGAPAWAPPRILQNSQSSDYTLVAVDAGKHIFHPAADTTARVWTIPANASVAFPIGTAVTFDNDIGAGALTIAITTDTLVLVGTAGTTGSRTLASGGQATAIKVTSTRWRISGVGMT